MRRIAAVALLATHPAWADAKPPMIPTRDVDVTYRMGSPEPDGPPLVQRMRWSMAAARLRVDPPTPGLYMIVDYQAHRMAVVKPAEHAVLDVAAPAMPGAAGAYARGAADTVAGLGCTNWETADNSGRATTLCLTADGVLLRASQAGTPLLEAISVAYTPQDPAAFTPPEDYRRVKP